MTAEVFDDGTPNISDLHIRAPQLRAEGDIDERNLESLIEHADRLPDFATEHEGRGTKTLDDVCVVIVQLQVVVALGDRIAWPDLLKVHRLEDHNGDTRERPNAVLHRTVRVHEFRTACTYPRMRVEVVDENLERIVPKQRVTVEETGVASVALGETPVVGFRVVKVNIVDQNTNTGEPSPQLLDGVVRRRVVNNNDFVGDSAGVGDDRLHAGLGERRGRVAGDDER